MKKIICFILATVLFMAGLLILPSCSSNEKENNLRADTDPLTQNEAIMIAKAQLEEELESKYSEISTISYGTISSNLETSYDEREYWEVTLQGSYRYRDVDAYGRGEYRQETFRKAYRIENKFGAGLNCYYLPYSHWY